jgi:AcrR family transcriptional regulator
MPKRDPEHMSAQRERIVRAAILCIADKGVERTTIADIWRKAGLSAGSLYVHFTNKDDIIAAALRFGSMTETSLPDTWEAFVAVASSPDSQMGFDLETIVRNRLHLHAESVHPGQLHDAFKPLLEQSLALFAQQLQRLADKGEIALKMSARQTAASMSALIDGMLWIALATDRSLEELQPEIAAGLQCFVEAPTAPKSR